MEITCPFCDCEFEALMWEWGQCPNCGEEYYWDDYYSDELEDEIISIEWTNI